MATIGIRELRQHASQYLRRVKAGETITVTDRGEPVARLVPITRDESVIERLEREGKLGRAQGDPREFLKTHPPLPPTPGKPLPSEILEEMRRDER